MFLLSKDIMKISRNFNCNFHSGFSGTATENIEYHCSKVWYIYGMIQKWYTRTTEFQRYFLRYLKWD